MRRSLAICLLWLAAGIPLLQAQEASSELRELIEQRITNIAEQLGDDSDVDLAELYDQLMDRFNDPINLNRTNAVELGSLYLLSDLQVNAILQHTRRYGKFLSIYELQAVEGMDMASLELIRPFVTISGEGRTRTSLKVMLEQGKHELLVRTQIGIEQKRGFLGRDPFGKPYQYPNGNPLPDLDDPAVMDSLRLNNKVYLGSPWKVYSRYRFQYRRNLSFGITAEKDEGEEFFKGTQKQGFDFYSAHLFLRDIGPFKAVALGDYQAQFGQGLTFSSGLSFARKSAYTMNITKNAQGLTPYTSVNENRFLRGAGVTMDLSQRLEATAFISKKGYDANVVEEADTLFGSDASLVTFSSFQEDGFHRTHRELEKKSAIQEFIYGGHLSYRGNGFTLGATAAQVDFGHELAKTRVYPYNQFDFQGQRNTTYGFDWNVPYRNVVWFGEASRSANGGMAGLTGVLAALDKRLSVAMLYRHLQRNFHGLYSSAFAEGSNPWNETGLYSGIELRPNRQWLFNAYYDLFSFPWLRYQTNAPSHGFETLGQLTWMPARGTQLYVKYRRQIKPRNTSEALSGVLPLVDTRQDNYRFNASYKVSRGVTLRTRVEHVDYQRGDGEVEHGFMLYQDIIHRPMRGSLQFTGRVMLFTTDSYDARLYAFESDVPGVFGLPPISGRGMRWYTMLRWRVKRGVDVWARYGITMYTDRESIGSGMNEIYGPNRSDLKLELRLKF